MRILLVAVCLLSMAWSGYWLFGARNVENGTRNWLDQRAEAGWVSNYSDVTTRGFPNRFDTTISDPELADPATGLAWSAPFLQLFRLSYSPHHVIVVWPERQTFASPRQRITVTSESAQGSLVFFSSREMHLDRSSIVADKIAMESSDGWTVEMTSALLATRPGGLANAVDVVVEAKDMRIGGTILDRFTKAKLTPGAIEGIKIDATFGFDAPWDKQALEIKRPGITSLDLKLMQINWGQLEFRAAGDLEVDGEGVPTGKITIRAQNWREMLELAVAAGWIAEAIAGPIESGLGFLASVSGNPNTLDAPLKFENGKIAFGPITLGDAPRLIIR